MSDPSKFYGLHILVEGENPLVNIVAVQGLASDPEKSWVWKAYSKADKKAVERGEKREPVNWLEELLPKDIPNAQIMAFNYESRWGKNAPYQHIGTCARLLLDALHNSNLQEEADRRPLVFVGHSFGGIVIERAIVEAILDIKYTYLLNMLAGIVFLGTPHRGAELAKYARYIAFIGKKLDWGSHSEILKDLEHDSRNLFELRNNFVRWLNKSNVQINCVFESLETELPGHTAMIVSEASASLDGYPAAAVDADHHSINKYWGLEDPSYVLIRGYLKRMIKELPKIMEHRRSPLKIVETHDGITDKDQRECLKCLFVTEPTADIEYVLQLKGNRTRKTCIWLVGSKEYVSWLAGDTLQLFHITGNAGIGKSMMSTFLVSELLEKSKTTKMIFAYYFCDNKDKRRNNATCVVRGLLLQLLRQRPSLFHHVLPEFSFKNEKLFSDFNDLWRIFSSVLADEALEPVYLLIDALDECTPSSCEGFLFSLKGLMMQLKTTNLHILITSRPEARILENISPHHSLQMDSNKINTDLKLYIDENVDSLALKKKYTKALQEDVRVALTERLGGTFLWVSLVIQDLSKTTGHRLVRQKIQRLPKTLEDIYDRIIAEIPQDSLPAAQLVLQLLATARRPLTRLELATAIVMYDWDEETLPSKDEIDEAAAEYTCCQSFLYISYPAKGNKKIGYDETEENDEWEMDDGEDTDEVTINFVHQSVKDYLLRQNSCVLKATMTDFVSQDLEFLMFGICWKYLSAKEFGYGHKIVSRNKENCLVSFPYVFTTEKEIMMRRHRFLGYSINEWLKHAKDSVTSMVPHTFWLATRIYTATTLRDRWFIHASGNGIFDFVSKLLDTGADREAKDDDGATALVVASWGGYEAVVQLLLQNGADIEAKDKHGSTALFAASWEGYEAVVQLLLQKGADIEAKTSDGTTALFAATRNGYKEVVQLLLQDGADTETAPYSGITALIAASTNGYKEVVELLLHKGADIEAKDDHRDTALLTASREGHEAVVQLLLQEGANLQARSEDGATSLISASRRGQNVVVQLLLQKGAEIEAKNDHGDTALLTASGEGHEAVVQLLLHKGADIEAKDKHGATSLFTASERGHRAVVQLLLQNGANIEGKDNYGATALLSASFEGHEAVVQLLLQKGANIKAKDNYGATALLTASCEGHNAVVQLLLQNGADIKAEDEHGATALFAASERGHEAIVQLLLQKRANTEASHELEETTVEITK